MGYIDSTAKIQDSEISKCAKIYKNVDIRHSIVGDKSIVGDFCRVDHSNLGYLTQIYPNGIMYQSSLCDYSYIQKNGSIWFASIGKFCSISWNVSIGGGEHDFHKVTSHSMLYAPAYGFIDEPLYDRFSNSCSIGNDVWIGSGASILRGVSIGDGAVIGAGAIVTKNVAPYSIVAGVPAKKIGQRCSDEIISELLEIKWWDFPKDLIKANIDIFNNSINKEVVDKLRELNDSLRD